MPEYHVWVAESNRAPSGFVNPEVRVTSEPILADSFDEAVQSYVDALPEGQQGLWDRGEDGVWQMCGCRVNPDSEIPVIEEGEIVEPGPTPTDRPSHELWVNATAVAEETSEQVVMLTPEPIVADTFDDAVQIYKEHLCDPATAEQLQITESGWELNGNKIEPRND